jgi:hypothetical protein
MKGRIKRRTEEQVRYLLQRGLELHREKIRRRASMLIAEFLGIKRLPRRLTFRDVEHLIEAIFRGRTQVKWMYDWALRYRGRWLAIKWAWYIRQKTYWRERFEEIAGAVDLYRRQYQALKKADIYYYLARLSAWADSYEKVEPEVCTAVRALGPVGEAVRFFRRITVYDGFMRLAMEVARAWPNRRYRVILALEDRDPKADRIADKGGVYITDFGQGRKRYGIYSFRVYGKELPQLVRQFGDELMVLQLWTIDPAPIAPECE